MLAEALTDQPPALDGCDLCGAEHWSACLCDPAAPRRSHPTGAELEAGREERLSQHERGRGAS